MDTTNGNVACIVDRHIDLHFTHTRTLRIILCFKREGAIERIQSIHLRMQNRGGSHSIKGILPHIGTNRSVIVKHDQSGSADRISCMDIRIWSDVETDIALTMLQRVVNRQESHLRANRLGTRGGINTLKNPEHLIMHNIYTCIHIHPNAQRVGHIQTLAIG